MFCMETLIYRRNILQVKKFWRENCLQGRYSEWETDIKGISQGKVTGGDKYYGGENTLNWKYTCDKYIRVVKFSEGENPLQEVLWRVKYDETVRFIFIKIHWFRKGIDLRKVNIRRESMCQGKYLERIKARSKTKTNW